MKCPACGHGFKSPVAQAGGRAGGAANVPKGFAVAGQPSAAARARAWKTRKARAERSPNILEHGKNVDLMYGQGNGSGYWKTPKDEPHIEVEVPTLKAGRGSRSRRQRRNDTVHTRQVHLD